MNIVNDLKAARQDLDETGITSRKLRLILRTTATRKYDYLSPMTFDAYLTGTKGFHPAVSDFYNAIRRDALDGTTAQASAYTSISFLALNISHRSLIRAEIRGCCDTL